MRVSLVSVLTLVLPLLAPSQENEKWQHVTTFEGAIIRIDTANVTFSTAFSGRIRFQILLPEPEILSKEHQIKYKSAIETLELKCDQRLYRIYGIEYFDEKGKELTDSSPIQK